MNRKDDDSSELSWLKSGAKNHEGSSKSSSVASPKPPDANDDTPSWLYEDTIPKKDEGKALIEDKNKGGAKSGVKWKQPINKKTYDNDHDDDDAADDTESCCCCCPADPMLFTFQCFHCTAGLTGLAALWANIYVFSGPTISVRDAIVRSYALLFCMLIVIIELDWRYIVNKIRFVDWWVFRGLFYTFVGFITFGFVDGKSEISDTPQDIVGIMLWAVGVCYIIMGTFCMKSMKQRRMIHLLQRKHAVGDDAASTV